MSRSNRARRGLAAFVVWLTCLGVYAARTLAAPGDIFNLGTLGGTSSDATGVNAAGQVTGFSVTADGLQHAFLYSGVPGSGGAMADLGTLAGAGSGGYSRGAGINALGQVTGTSSVADGYHAFLYTGTPGNGGVMQDLGTLGSKTSDGFAINDSGQVAGTSDPSPTESTHIFIYSGTPGRGGAMQDLGGGNVGRGNVINNSGELTGSYISAYLYRGGTTYDLGTLGGFTSGGNGINNAGQVAGYSGLAGGAVGHAFLYTGIPGSGGVMHDLGSLGGSGFSAGATGINNEGDVVGTSEKDAAHRVVPFLYVGTPGVDGHMIDLNAWVKATDPAEAAKWTVTEVTGISDTGLIVGTGTYNDGPGGLTDGTRAFLLDASSLAPEPSTLVVAAAAACGPLLRRRAGRATR